MSSVDEHLRQARHNDQVATAITAAAPDWAAVVYFYAAMHYVEAYAARMQQPHDLSHEERRRLVYRTKELRPVQGEYRKLYEYSVAARYQCLANGHELLNPQYVATRVQSLAAAVARRVEQALSMTL